MADALRGIPGTDEFIRTLSHAVGLLAVQFGLFEFSLNAAIAIIHHGVAQPIAARGELLYMLKERLRYVRSAANLYAPLEPYRAELRDLMTLAKRLSKTRNGVLHGYPGDYDADTHRLIFVSASPDKADKSMHREQRFIATMEDLLDHGVRAEGLAARMGLLCHRMIDEGGAQGRRLGFSQHTPPHTLQYRFGWKQCALRHPKVGCAQILVSVYLP